MKFNDVFFSNETSAIPTDFFLGDGFVTHLDAQEGGSGKIATLVAIPVLFLVPWGCC